MEVIITQTRGIYVSAILILLIQLLSVYVYQTWRHSQSLYIQAFSYIYIYIVNMHNWIIIYYYYNEYVDMISLPINFILWWHHYHRGHADLLLLHFAFLPWGSFEGGLPPSPQVLVLEGYWGLLSPGRLKLHTHTRQGMWYRDTRTSNRNNVYSFTNIQYIWHMTYDTRIHLSISTCVHTCIRMHRVMHVTHISSVLVQKVGVFGSSRTSKFFTWQQRNTQMFAPTHGHSQPPTHVHTCMYVQKPTSWQKLQIHTTLKTLP